MENDIPNILSHLHISDPNLLQYEFLRRLLVEDNFLAHKKMHIFEYECKTCLKELGIFLKFGETFQTFLAAFNSSKNTGLS